MIVFPPKACKRSFKVKSAIPVWRSCVWPLTEKPINPPENKVMKAHSSGSRVVLGGLASGCAFCPPRQLHTQHVIERLAGNPSFHQSLRSVYQSDCFSSILHCLLFPFLIFILGYEWSNPDYTAKPCGVNDTKGLEILCSPTVLGIRERILPRVCQTC